jgi:hypothetical protein
MEYNVEFIINEYPWKECVPRIKRMKKWVRNRKRWKVVDTRYHMQELHRVRNVDSNEGNRKNIFILLLGKHR